jgi:putative ABC transport system ATP-binding protein
MSDADRTLLRKTTVGFIFQKYNLLPTLTAADNIAIARHIAGRNGVEKDPQFEEVLKLLGIAGRMHHKPRALSGGEQQRVAIARALVKRPALILADEPTGQLDTLTGANIIALLKEIASQSGVTVVVASHDPNVHEAADWLFELRDGQLVR